MDQTSGREIAQWLADFVDGQMLDLAEKACKIGEDALAIARGEHVYTTQSGNLQSSCGFAVTYDGNIAQRSAFPTEPGKNRPDGKTGSQAGKDYLEECLESKLDKGITLTMVAGMDYAGYVEDWGGDVLKSAEAYVIIEFDKLTRK